MNSYIPGSINLGELLIIIVIWAIWPAIGGYVASQKRRRVVEGVLMGCLGPIGVIIEALLPTNRPNERLPSNSVQSSA